jgi:hypothetical protein
MRLGVTRASSRPDGGALTGDALIAGARLVEQIGFDSLWSFDAPPRPASAPWPRASDATGKPVGNGPS